MEMKAAWVYIHDDTQGPWVPLCGECIEADGHEVYDDDWIDDCDFRCACCGATENGR